MSRSLQTIVIAWVAGLGLLVTSLAMCEEKEKSAANDNKAAKVEKRETKQVPYLGVAVEPLHPAFWFHLRDVIEHKQGLLVAHVAEDSPAKKAGVKLHDILMTYGDQKLFSPDQLTSLVHADKAGHEVKLDIVRDGKSAEINVALGEHSMPTVAMSRPPMSHLPRWMARQAPGEQESPWTSFDSLSLKSLGDNRYKVEIGYETKEGKIEHHTFEGTCEEIRQSIASEKDLPANEKEHLLRSLDLPNGDLQLEVPTILRAPDGWMIWDFRDLDEAFSPLSGSDF